MRMALGALLGLSMAAVACSAAPPARPVSRPPPERRRPPSLPHAQVILEGASGEVAVDVEVARTEPAVRRGLMMRRQLAANAGMLFVFARSEHQVFWMRNTLIPLDMLFIGADQRVVGIVEDAEPRTDTDREVEGESLFVLEVNGGFCETHGITPGSIVRFVGVPGLP